MRKGKEGIWQRMAMGGYQGDLGMGPSEDVVMLPHGAPLARHCISP